MNWFRTYKNLFQSSILLLLFVTFNSLLKAQGCDFLETDAIQVNSTIYNMDADYTQQYALTSTTGQILDIQSSPSFPPQSAGSYVIYALNYETASGISGWNINDNISTISGTCFDTTHVVVNVCLCSADCHSTDGTINLSIAGANTSADFTQSYALTDNTGAILDINTNPISLSSLFSGKATGNYRVYALNYETVSGINNYFIGNSIDLVTGTCLDMEGPICYNICQAPPPTDNYTGCNSNDGTVSITHTNFNQELGYTQSYALTDTNGIIQRIKDNPSNLQPLFVAVAAGKYRVYALNYETASGINNYSIGATISGVSGSCLAMTTPIYYQVCPCPFTGCNADDGRITINSIGFNSANDFNQVYILTDTFGIIIDTTTNAPSQEALFTSIPENYYHIYGLNYETASGINGLTTGNNIAAITGTCFDITGALCYQICNDNYDFGDLPDTSDSTEVGDYQTLLANNGPRHLIISGLSLGDTIDMEVDGLPDAIAQGDGIDEDGLIIFPSIDVIAGMNFRLPLSYVNITGDTAYIKAWIDWNADGDFEDMDELVFDANDADSPIPNRMEMTTSANVINDFPLGFRIRISLQDNMTPYGPQPNGEVEDYFIRLNCPKICLPITVDIRRGK